MSSVELKDQGTDENQNKTTTDTCKGTVDRRFVTARTLTRQQEDAADNCVTGSKHSKILILPNHSVNVEGELEGFCFQCHEADPAYRNVCEMPAKKEAVLFSLPPKKEAVCSHIATFHCCSFPYSRIKQQGTTSLSRNVRWYARGRSVVGGEGHGPEGGRSGSDPFWPSSRRRALALSCAPARVPEASPRRVGDSHDCTS